MITTAPKLVSSSRTEMPPALLLGLDCATPYLALSIVDLAGTPVASLSLEVGRDHAAQLLPQLKVLLADAGATGRDVAAIGVGVGPGSYTGVRVGIATARGLARAWSVPVAGSSSLLTLLPGWPHVDAAAPTPAALLPGQRGVALLDARRDNVYALLAERSDSAQPRFTVLEGPLKLARRELDERFPGVPRFEDLAPDAAVLAFAAMDGGDTAAHYL